MQELLQDINALRRGIEALNKRSLEQGKPVSRAELDEVLAKVKQEVRFTIDYKGVAEAIQPHLATPAKVETTLTTGTAQLQQVIAQIPRSVPVVGEVWGFTSVRLALGVIVLLMGLICLSTYLWKERGVAEAQVATLQQQQAQQKASLDWLSKGYFDLKRDNPKAVKKYFP
ncbi:hypothetical protein SAMN00120144_4347 [Hymenobacter roseosalivarius DSM 11622]|uniref:Uncharacterized protein n=1 Tax=Hymenobacter roseosalivarius DSM 11622 TaxID=645990 RepID=A0A1W1W675_9BACT|nr:hypothetical protein [Hymenobacter roseosalivarius]SMC00604.1 hypothetical protein SAMN00120144_4347 [Hymenobacter roseosalivarius DSM 11622]